MFKITVPPKLSATVVHFLFNPFDHCFKIAVLFRGRAVSGHCYTPRMLKLCYLVSIYDCCHMCAVTLCLIDAFAIVCV